MPMMPPLPDVAADASRKRPAPAASPGGGDAVGMRVLRGSGATTIVRVFRIVSRTTGALSFAQAATPWDRAQ